MDKKLVKTIVAVVLAICLFIMLTATVSLAFDAFLSKDATIVADASSKIKNAIFYISDASIALACLLVPTLACFIFSFCTRQKKVFHIASAVLTLVIAATCMGFLFDLRHIALKEFNSTAYAVCAEFFSNLITLTVASLISCIYFIVNAVMLFKQPKEQPVSEEAQHEEV